MIYKKMIRALPILVLLLIGLPACKPQRSENVPPKDFSQIISEKKINVGILSGSMSYFIYKGEKMGYEYELLKSFAESYKLEVNLLIAENETRLLELLEEGKIELIAYNIPITNSGKEQFLYCGRETINEQMLIQRSNKGDTILKDVTELIGKEVWVIHDSKYYRRLINLNDELGGGIHIQTIDKDTIAIEDLIEMVSRGKIAYTFSDKDMAKLNKTYYSNLNINLNVSHPQRSAWAVRKNSPLLAQTINEWFDNKANTPIYKSIIKRYFEMSKLPGDAPAPIIGNKQISNFDTWFKHYAKQISWDWRLMASIAYQESKFLTDRVSWAGATGLMGLMPRTAQALGFSPEEMTQPEINIQAATQLIKRLNKSFSAIEDENEKIKFIIASYNAGSGHIYDAQALAVKYGKNPFVWEGNVEECLKMKSLPEYYNDPVCKQGYFRGTETIRYISAVTERWEYYKKKVKN